MLADIISRLGEPGAAEAAVIESGDLTLLADIRAASAGLGMDAGEFASLAVRRFADRADDDAWLQLISATNRSETPGLTTLTVILRRAVADAREAVA